MELLRLHILKKKHVAVRQRQANGLNRSGPNRLVRYFEKCTHSLSCQELDEKVNNTHVCTITMTLLLAAGKLHTLNKLNTVSKLS